MKKRMGILLGAALLAAGPSALAHGWASAYDDSVIRYVDRDEDWSVSIRLGDSSRSSYHDAWNRAYRAPAPVSRWTPPGQYRKDLRRSYREGYRRGYREGFRDGVRSERCYEDRSDWYGRTRPRQCR